MKFTINLTPVTKKNSQRIVVCHGRPMILPSAKYKEYEKLCAAFMPDTEQIKEAVNVKAIYFMPTRRCVDLINLHEALHDVLVKYGVLLDDNSKIIVSTDGSCVRYDKEHPRTEVVITKEKEADNG